MGWDGCGYYRSYLPLSHLGKHGHQVSFALTAPEGPKWLPEAATQAGTVDVLHGQLISGRTGMGLWEEWCGHTRLVMDVDDDIFSATYPASPWVRYPELLPVAKYTLGLSDVVTTTTPTLAEVLSPFCERVVVLPNVIHADLTCLDRPRRERVTVGWTNSPSHVPDAEYVGPMLRRFLARNPAVDFHVIGYDFRATLGVEGRHTMWTTDLWDYYRLIDFDIGIAPLAPNRFNRSKSQLKALEYAALGIPVVASDLDPYREFVLDGVTGYLVKHDHEWEKRLRELACDEAMRVEMGAKAREHAAGWTVQERWTEWERALAD